MRENRNRREFLRDTVTVGAAMAAGKAARLFGAEAGAAAADDAAAAAICRAAMPMIKVGKVAFSRIILGSNPFFGFAHGNPQGAGMREWYTPERIKAAMDDAADHGITAVWTPAYGHWIKLWLEYKEKGGKLKYWFGQPDAGGEDGMKKAIQACIDNGAKAICIQGVQIDNMMRHKRYDGIKAWLEQIRSAGLPAGMASHQSDTHLKAEDLKLPTDYYHQCMGVPERYTGEFREKPLATMRKIDKPVIGYKVLGAGRLKPAEAIPHVLKNCKPIDGICVGVYPNNNPHQIRENVELTIAATKEAAAARARTA